MRTGKRILIVDDARTMDEAWLSGADGYITKPFEPRNLVQKVEDVLFTVTRLAP